MPPKIVGELAHRRVTFLWIFLEGLADDRIEIPFEKPVQPIRRSGAVGGPGGEIRCRGLSGDGCGRWRRRIGLDDGLEQVGGRGELAPGMLPCQQNVQQQTQRIDIRRRRGLPSSNLLGCGISRCESRPLLERQRRDLPRLPLGAPDKCPEDLLNRILWHAMKGSEVPYPAWAVHRVDDDE